jgi:uncharacterized protein YecE (DUF72 family)
VWRRFSAALEPLRAAGKLGAILLQFRYTDAELKEWAPNVRALARDAGQTHVLFNNCYRDNAQTNGQQFAALLQP